MNPLKFLTIALSLSSVSGKKSSKSRGPKRKLITRTDIQPFLMPEGLPLPNIYATKPKPPRSEENPFSNMGIIMVTAFDGGHGDIYSILNWNMILQFFTNNAKQMGFSQPVVFNEGFAPPQAHSNYPNLNFTFLDEGLDSTDRDKLQRLSGPIDPDMDVKEYSDFIKHRNNHWNNTMSQTLVNLKKKSIILMNFGAQHSCAYHLFSRQVQLAAGNSKIDHVFISPDPLTPWLSQSIKSKNNETDENCNSHFTNYLAHQIAILKGYQPGMLEEFYKLAEAYKTPNAQLMIANLHLLNNELEKAIDTLLETIIDIKLARDIEIFNDIIEKMSKKKLDKRLNKKRKELNHLVKKFNQDNPGISQVIPEISKQYPKMKNLNLTKKKKSKKSEL